MKCLKVSVIVPVYKVEKYLDRCLKSIVNQTLRDIEIILIDDGSPDECPQMCDSWSKKDTRISVIHKENEGLGFARNSGMEKAIGEYVAFIDSDDCIDNNMFENLYMTAVGENADVVYSGIRRIMDGKCVFESKYVSEKKTFENEKISDLTLGMIASPLRVKKERLYGMSSCLAVYRKQILDDNNIRFRSEREVVSEDLLYNVQFLKKARKVVYLPDIFYSYWMNSSSLTHSFKENKFDGMITLYHELSKETMDIDPNALRSKRFMIGYARSECSMIASMDAPISRKIQILKYITGKNVWNEVSDYPYKTLPSYAALIFFLSKHKSNYMLLVVSQIFYQLKQILKK